MSTTNTLIWQSARAPLLMALLISIGLLKAAEPPGDDLVKKEVQKLQGDWKVVSAEDRGQTVPQEYLREMGLIVENNTMITTFAGEGTAAEWHLIRA